MIKNTMKNIIFTFVFVAGILFVGALQTQAEVISDVSTDADQDAVVAAIDVVSDTSTDTDQDGAAGVASDSSTDLAQDGSAGIVADSSTDTDQDGAAGITSSPSTDEDQDGHTSTTPTDNGTNGGSNGSTSNGGGSSRNSRTSASVTTIATSSCPLITDYLKLGGENNPLQVTKLQIFLKNSEGANLTVNGIFDQQTEDAVKAFQKKYMTDILGPWDATRATGFVFITTMKKVNALACAQPVVLSAEETAIIEAYKARGGSDQAGSEIGASATGSEQVGMTDGTSDNDNVAAVGKASILSRFWNFLKNLFK